MINIKLKIFIAIAVIVLAGSGAFWFFFYRDIKTEGQRNISVPISDKSADMSEAYTNQKYGFSFSHPKEFSVSEFTESSVDVILVKDATSSGVFQISVSPFDEPGPVTKERILKDIPNMVITNDKIISVGGEKALSFKSKDESGETSEIWFIRGGNLYQITALPDFENKMDKILETMLLWN